MFKSLVIFCVISVYSFTEKLCFHKFLRNSFYRKLFIKLCKTYLFNPYRHFFLFCHNYPCNASDGDTYLCIQKFNMLYYPFFLNTALQINKKYIRRATVYPFVLPNALRAANDVKFTMIVSIASMACWRVGFSYIIGVRMGMGAIGVWIAMVVDWVCRVTCFVTRFRSGVWKEKYKA